MQVYGSYLNLLSIQLFLCENIACEDKNSTWDCREEIHMMLPQGIRCVIYSVQVFPLLESLRRVPEISG